MGSRCKECGQSVDSVSNRPAWLLYDSRTEQSEITWGERGASIAATSIYRMPKYDQRISNPCGHLMDEC